MTLDEKKKIFEDGIEKGKAEMKKEIDDLWEMHFNLLDFVDDVNMLMSDAVEVLEANPDMVDEFPEGWLDFAEATIEYADDITSFMYEDDGLPEEDEEEEDEIPEV